MIIESATESAFRVIQPQGVHPHIGLKLPPSANLPTAITCPECKNEFGQYETICPHCGYDLRGKRTTYVGLRTASPSGVNTDTPSGRKAGAMTAGVLAGLGLICMLIWCVRHIFAS